MQRGDFIKSRQGQQHCNKVFFVGFILLIHEMIWPSEFPVIPVLFVKCLLFIGRILKPQLLSSVVQYNDVCFAIYEIKTPGSAA